MGGLGAEATWDDEVRRRCVTLGNEEEDQWKQGGEVENNARRRERSGSQEEDREGEIVFCFAWFVDSGGSELFRLGSFLPATEGLINVLQTPQAEM